MKTTFTRSILLCVEPDGSIQPYFDGFKGFAYQCWSHFFACGISQFTDGDRVRVWARI